MTGEVCGITIHEDPGEIKIGSDYKIRTFREDITFDRVGKIIGINRGWDGIKYLFSPIIVFKNYETQKVIVYELMYLEKIGHTFNSFELELSVAEKFAKIITEYLTRKTLRDCLPHEFISHGEYVDIMAYKYKDVLVVRKYDTWKRGEGWIGSHKNVHVWYELENGYAVGWNENPSRGWSFPVVKLKKEG